jgi:hypothetical protein
MPSLDVQHRFANLRRWRVQLRDRIRRSAAIADPIDRRRAIENWEGCLKATEREWRELQCMLGLPPERPPVKLAVRR